MPVLELLLRRAPRSSRSFDPATRTVEVVIATDTPIPRRDFEGEYDEVLAISRSAVSLKSLVGAPVLDSHDRSTVHAIVGKVIDAQIADAAILATLKLSGREDVKPILVDIADGIVDHVSVGYTVERWQEGTNPQTGRRTRTAVNWTPREVSLVALPADRNATIRSEDNMTTKTATPAAPATDPATITRATTDEEIRSIARIAGLDDAFVTAQLERNATADQVRAAAFEALASRGGGPIRTATTQIGPSNDDPVTRAGWMGEALYARLHPSHQLSEPARQYAGASMVEMARETLRLRGLATTALSPAAVITRSLHTTSDFSIILGDAVGRTLRSAYQSAPAGVRQLGRQTTAKDFRTKHRIQLGEAPTLKKVNEAGEFTSGTMAEAKESYKLDSFGRIIGISRQAIVSDDLGAFADLSRRFGIAAAAFEAQFLVDLLVSNSGNGPTMSDTVALFDASAHKNKAASGAAPDETTLKAARLAMRKQTGLGSELIAVTPKFVLVPADLETVVEKLLTTIQATKTSDVNPFSSLSLIVEPRLTSATRWYVAADPAEIDGLEYAYLEGQPGPQIESRNGFEVDGVQIKVRLDFGAGFVDHRGWFMNAGA